MRAQLAATGLLSCRGPRGAQLSWCAKAHPLELQPISISKFASFPPSTTATASGRIGARMAIGPLWARLGNARSRSTAKSAALQLIGFATWIPVIAWVNLHVAELTLVDGPSMYPLINEDRDSTLRRDLVMNYKWAPQEGLERGMIVTLRSPTHPEVVAVKRVVALEGDVVATKAPYPISTVQIPQGHVWVEGDGPPGSSLDSNTYGPVSKRLLTGRVTHVVYPWRKFGPVRWWEHERRPTLAD